MAEKETRAKEGKEDNTLYWLLGGGLLLVGGYFVIKPLWEKFFGPGPAASTIKQAIEAKIAVYKGTYDAFTPPLTAEQADRLNQMEQSISLEERQLAAASQSQFEALLNEANHSLGLAIPIIGTAVGGYAIVWLLQRYKDKGRGGGDFGGSGKYVNQKNGRQFFTSPDLERDIMSYSVARANLSTAQSKFNQLPVSVRVAVAGEAGVYGNAWMNWQTLNDNQVRGLAFGAAYLASIGALAVVTLLILEQIPVLALASVL